MVFFRIDVLKRMPPHVALIFIKLDIHTIWLNLLIEKNSILDVLVELFVALILFIVTILIHSGRKESLCLTVKLTNGWMTLHRFLFSTLSPLYFIIRFQQYLLVACVYIKYDTNGELSRWCSISNSKAYSMRHNSPAMLYRKWGKVRNCQPSILRCS